MKAVIQRVTSASVQVEGKTVGQIESGLLVLLGVAKGDGESDGRFLVEKIRTLRIFSDEQGKMNRSLADIGGSVLLVSQFTLLGGRRMAVARALTRRRPRMKQSDYTSRLWQRLRDHGTHVETGVFAAHMQVELLNDGPVTFVLNSREA